MSSWVNAGGWRDLRREEGDFSTKVKGGGLPVSFFRIPPPRFRRFYLFPLFHCFFASRPFRLCHYPLLFSLSLAYAITCQTQIATKEDGERSACAPRIIPSCLSLSSPLSSFSHVVRRRCPIFALPPKSERRGDSPNFSGQARWANNHPSWLLPPLLAP